MRVVGFWKADAEQVRQALLERLANPRTLDNWYAQRLKRSSRRAWLELQRARDAETARDKAIADLREFRSAAIASSKLASEREQVLSLSLESAEQELRAALDRLAACEPVIEPERFAELLKLAANESEEESNDKPDGARFGDILSNGWAGNRNPLKLFMLLRTSGKFIEGITRDGIRIQQEKTENRLVRVLPRETPDLWGTWKKLADALATTPDMPLPAKVTT